MSTAAGSSRYVVLGLAPARAAWFSSLGLWANAGALPVEFVKCLSAEEVRVRLRSGRPLSAVVADAELPAIDRDLVAAARAANCAVILVADPRRPTPSLPDVTAVLEPRFGRDELLAALRAGATPVPHATADATVVDLLPRRHDGATAPAPEGAHRTPSTLVALTGPGGTGVSVAAMALARALGRADAPPPGGVVLADLCLNAEQGLFHGRDEPGPGLQELVEASRRGEPSPETVRSLAGSGRQHAYDLLTGLRRARLWPVVRPRAFEAALAALGHTYGGVVCDTDADFEGEAEGGSADVEDRHVMARTVAARADAVLVVGLASLKGIHGLVRVLGDVAHLGVSPNRTVAVVNRMPRSPRDRARVASAVADLALAATGTTPGGLVFLPEDDVEVRLRDGRAMPAALGAPLAGALAAVLERASPGGTGHEADPGTPVRVRPGSLGVWAGA